MDVWFAITCTFGVITTLFLIIDGAKWNKSKILRRIIIVVICCGAIYTGFQTYYSNKKNDVVEEITNSVLNITDTNLINDFAVQLGNSGAKFMFLNSTTFGFQGTQFPKLFKIYKFNGKLALVSASLKFGQWL